jgi:transcriptional regulator with XRE-family HTH domain
MTETIAHRLKRLMDDARIAGMKVSAKSLSLAVGGGETYVGDIIRGRVQNPSMSKLIKIAKQLKVPVEQLIPDDEAGEPSDDYVALREAAEEYRQAAPDGADGRPVLDPDILAVILAALPYALKRLGAQPPAERISEAIYRTHGWMLDEVAARRYPSPDGTINFLSHIL